MEDEDQNGESVEDAAQQQIENSESTDEDINNEISSRKRVKQREKVLDPYARNSYGSIAVNLPPDLHLTLRSPDVELLKEFPRLTRAARKITEGTTSTIVFKFKGVWIRAPAETEHFRKNIWTKNFNKIQHQEITLLESLNYEVRCTCGTHPKKETPKINCFKGRIGLHQAVAWYRISSDDTEALQEAEHVDEGLVWLCALATKGWDTVCHHQRESRMKQFELPEREYTHVLTLPCAQDWVKSRVANLTMTAINIRWCNMLAGVKDDSKSLNAFKEKMQTEYEEAIQVEEEEQPVEEELNEEPIKEEDNLINEEEEKYLPEEENVEPKEFDEEGIVEDDEEKSVKRQKIRYRDLKKQGFPPILMQQLGKEFQTAPARIPKYSPAPISPPRRRYKKRLLNPKHEWKPKNMDIDAEAASELLNKCNVPNPEELESKITELNEKIEEAIHYATLNMEDLNTKLDTDGFLGFEDFLSDGFAYDSVVFDTVEGFRLAQFCKTAIKMLFSLDTMTQRITALISYVLFAFKEIQYQHEAPSIPTLFQNELYNRRISFNLLHVLFKFMCDVWNRYIMFHGLAGEFRVGKSSMDIWKVDRDGNLSKCTQPIRVIDEHRSQSDPDVENDGSSLENNNNANNMDYIRCKLVKNAQGTVWTILDVGSLLFLQSSDESDPQINYELLDATDIQPFSFLRTYGSSKELYFRCSTYSLPLFDWNNFRTSLSQDYYQYGVPQRWQYLARMETIQTDSDIKELISSLSAVAEPVNPFDLFQHTDGLLGLQDLPSQDEDSPAACHQCGNPLPPDEHYVCCMLCRAGRIRASQAQEWYGLSLSELAFIDNFIWPDTFNTPSEVEVHLPPSFDEARVRHFAVIKSQGDESKIDLQLASSRPSHPKLFLMDESMWSSSKSTWGVVARRIEIWNAVSS